MRALAPLALLLLAPGCGNSPVTPEDRASSLVVTAVSPSAGGTVVVPTGSGSPPGVVLPIESGLISVGLSMHSDHEVPWAQLNVYLLSGSDYCGQNLPDSPTWDSLPAGWTDTYAVTGFQVFRLPCDVTGIRAMLHTRKSGLLTPPLASETIAETTTSTSFRIERCCS